MTNFLRLGLMARLSLLAALFLAGCTSQSSTSSKAPFPLLRGEYLGQEPPGDQPRLFAPGIVSTGMVERDFAITPEGDQIFWCRILGPHTWSTIMTSRLVAGSWTAPEIASFARDLRYQAIEPFIAPDGTKLLFVSNRPAPDKPLNDDIWVCDRTATGWSEPYNLGAPVNTDGPEFFPTLTREGTLYFTRDDRTNGQSAIWRARLAGGRYAQPERLPAQVNSTPYCFNAFVAPDESYLIVPTYGRGDSHGKTDYYVCFRRADDSWTEPINLGDRVNSEGGDEYSASVTPDGRYLFFMAARPDTASMAAVAMPTADWLQRQHAQPGNGYPDIWWVDATFIAGLQGE
jgi:hypothetical protein